MSDIELFFSLSSDLFCVINPDGRLHRINPAFVKAFDWAEGETRLMPWQRDVLPEDRDNAKKITASLAAGQAIHEIEIWSQVRDGIDRLFSWSVFPEAGTGRWFVIGRDVTEQRLISDAHLAAEARWRRAFFQSPIGAAVVSLDYRFLDVNDSFCKIVGYDRAELLSLSFPEITHPDDLEKDLALTRRVASGELEHYELEKRYVRKDGSSVWALLSVRLLRDNGAPVCFLPMVQDITQRRRVEEQVLRLNASLERRVQERTAELDLSNKELSAFTFSVSHDLRSPLRGIDGWSLALLEDYGDKLDEKGRVFIGRIRSESQRMGQLIDDMLRLSRITLAEMNLRTVDFSKLTHDIFAKLREANPDRRVECVVEPNITAIGDEAWLDAVFTNLLENSWKFTQKNGAAKIEFGTISNPNEKVYFVRDNGVGFDAASATRLFTPFHRMHRLSEFPGTGVGLAIVHRVINRHHGRIWAESQVNRGATFYFTLGTGHEKP